MSGVTEESATVLPFDGGPAEQAIRTQQVQVVGPDAKPCGSPGGGQWLVLAPVTERGEAIGVLELTVPARPRRSGMAAIAPAGTRPGVRGDREPAAHRPVRVGAAHPPLSLSAEIQHRLLPGPQTCEAGAFTLAGWLEPAAAIAGDTFDFNLARDVLHLSLTDAMGHGVGAALTATLCVGSLRNARNAGASLLEQVTSTNRALVEHAAASGLEDFVTGLIGRLDLRTGSAELVNAGHIPPYLVRESRSVPLDLPVHLPLGLFGDTAYGTSRSNYSPGTGWCSSPTAWSNATPAASTSPKRSPRPGRCTREKRSERWPTESSRRPATAHRRRDVLCLDWHGGTDETATATTAPNRTAPAAPRLIGE